MAIGPVPATPPERIFTHAALRRAWLAVKRTGGGGGMDGVTIQKFEANLEQELTQLHQQLVSGAYRPQPLGRILFPKPKGGWRELALWALRDRVAQRAIYDILTPVYEAIFLPCSFGFRPGRGVQDAIRCLQEQRDQNLHWVVDADIKDCFDSIESKALLRCVAEQVHDPLLLRYIEGWLTAKIFNSADGLPEEAGASQGSVLSPLLANIYLHPVDQALLAQKLALIRYADDLMICCQRKSEAVAALATLERVLAQSALQLSPRKTAIRHFDQGFAWLGHFFIRRECYQL